MKATIYIRDNETGEVRQMAHELMENVNGTKGPWIWSWTDDGFSCDCNREIFFYRECCQGSDEIQPFGALIPPCTTGGYYIRIVEADSGRVLYDEFDRDFAEELADRNLRIRDWLLREQESDPEYGDYSWLAKHPPN